VCSWLCATSVHNTTQNSSDKLTFYNHHSSASIIYTDGIYGPDGRRHCILHAMLLAQDVFHLLLQLFETIYLLTFTLLKPSELFISDWNLTCFLLLHQRYARTILIHLYNIILHHVTLHSMEQSVTWPQGSHSILKPNMKKTYRTINDTMYIFQVPSKSAQNFTMISLCA